jgi:NAD(P)-dependent dehydrogenase (short-subunit alcohol dehydrogenase family)
LQRLIGTPGVRGYPKDKTTDGFEQHFGINHLGHFALFQVVKDALVASSTPTYSSRVVVLTAQGHRQSKVRFDDFSFDNRPEEYQPLLAYAQSKIANIYMSLEIERRFSAQGVHSTSVNPGVILGTGLNRKTPPEQMAGLLKIPAIRNGLKSPGQGAATTVWAATAKDWEGVGGKYLENVQVAVPYDQAKGQFAPGYAEHAYDEDAAKTLWVESLKLIGLE